MKTILCFGDSNTWGWNPVTKARYGYEERWPGILRQELGDGYLVVEEGQNGRTTVWDDPIEGNKNGALYLLPCLESHHPVDLVIIMLGTNDLKARFSLSACDIARGAGVLVSMVQRSSFGPGGHPPQVLLVAPPPLGRLSEFADIFEGGVEKSRLLGSCYRQIADEYGCHFIDAGEFVVPSDADGVHLDAEGHRDLGRAIAGKVRAIL